MNGQAISEIHFYHRLVLQDLFLIGADSDSTIFYLLKLKPFNFFGKKKIPEFPPTLLKKKVASY
jgi:hypothetical protein